MRGLDDILVGSLAEFSFNIIVGTASYGTKTMIHQVAFANCTPKRPALYFTFLGEPVMKMMRYQQQFSYFGSFKPDEAVRFINPPNAVLTID